MAYCVSPLFLGYITCCSLLYLLMTRTKNSNHGNPQQQPSSFLLFLQLLATLSYLLIIGGTISLSTQGLF